MRSAWNDEETRDRRGVPRARARDPRRARRPRRAKAARRASLELLQSWGGVDHRLPPAPDRQPLVHAQPRGSREGARGRHPLRRGPHAARASRSTSYGHARALRVSRAARATTTAVAETASRAARAHDPGRRRHAAQHRARARGRRALRARRHATSRPCDENGDPVQARARRAKPRAVRVLLSRAARRPLHQLLRRPASVVLRQRREGDGQRPSRAIPVVEPRARATCAPASARTTRDFFAQLERRAARHGARGRCASRRRSSRSSCARRWPRGASSPGQFYRLQNFETLRRAAPTARALAMEGLALTGAWVDREQGLVSTIVLEMGGSSDLCALLQAGRAGGADGPDRHADRDRRAARRWCSRAAGSATRCCSRSAQALRAAGSRVLYFAGYKKMHRPLQGRRDRGRRRRGRLVLRRGARASRPTRPQDRALRRQHRAGDGSAYARGALGAQPIPFARRRPHHRHRLRPHDGGGRRARGTACSRRTSSRATSRIGSINSPMQCMMKEICAQCLQPHVDPATGKTTLRLLLLQPGPAARPRRLRGAARSASAQNSRAGEAHRAVDRPLPEAPSSSRRAQSRLTLLAFIVRSLARRP